MNVLVIDFETYYDKGYSLRNLSIPEYVFDPRFHVIGLAIRHPDGRTEFNTDVCGAVAALKAEYGDELEKTTVVFHNSYFDNFILYHRYGLHVRNFIDSMLLAYHVHGRRGKEGGADASLKGLSQRYGLSEKGNIDFMCGVREPNVVQLADLSEYACNDVSLTFEIAGHLLAAITRPEVEIPLIMHTVRLAVERGVHVDLEGTAQLSQDATRELDEWTSKLDCTVKDLASNKKFGALLESALARTGRKVPLKQGKGGLIPAIAKKDQEMQVLLNDRDPVVALLAHARLQKKSDDQIQSRLEKLTSIAKASGGKLYPHIVYHGAATGRFSGGGGFNIQNLGRDGMQGKVRELLLPAPGRKFLVGDFAQIEARITAWLAGQTSLMNAFARGDDVYSRFAAGAFQTEVRKPNGGDDAETAARLKALRQVGKMAVLGLVFGMGAIKFMNSLLADPLTAHLFDSGQLSPAGCKRLVVQFREEYSAIKAVWGAFDAAFRCAILGESCEVAGVRFERDRDIVMLWLPSGRALRYPNARLEDVQKVIKYLDDSGEIAEFSPEGDSIVYGKDTVLYGGKITENIAQAIARDLLADAILRLEEQGFRVVFHIHDEVVAEDAIETAIEREKEFLECLRTVPAWCVSLPIEAETQVLDRYGK